MSDTPIIQHNSFYPNRKKTFKHTKEKYAIIGAGPSGLAAARCLLVNQIPFDGFEAYRDVGGLWNIKNPRSTVYESAHLISSKKMTEFKHFPMREEVADFPDHKEVLAYLQDYARMYDLHRRYHFNTPVKSMIPRGDFWEITSNHGESNLYKGVIIANGTLAKPRWPDIPLGFKGEIMHSSQYKSSDIFSGKRVLIVGAGNSGCDIAVDAVHRAKKVGMSVRRGYYFVPKYLFGKPADMIGGKITLPRWLKQGIDRFLLKFFVPNAKELGFPDPDYKLYESHPIVNSLILHHLGHGDIIVWPQITGFDGKKVIFRDGSQEKFDLILMATGYELDFPFIEKKYLHWKGVSPDLYLNIFHPSYNNLFVMGMVEATGLGWQGRYEQAKLVAEFILGLKSNEKGVKKLIEHKKYTKPDTSGGYNYLKLDRMAYYVHKETYLKQLRKHMKMIQN